ncbi:Transcriptional regulator, LytTr family [Croceitalea dokdonensis DOKDO 023]|uniref:Transcriptional regulator, LytTr family n=1 Tax=Croceitalea dokdonensis DOKDO 023 TaxID=1300341 RepID=A0A0N8H3J1_9FLAO|nr:LytTR family DNA-binding domain-containing protein [Croceitalea dokdonensis]KPM30716.1 Transcriptional regulator, LytTr family [Croceitalea dokdonensis DOKDO 023]
MQWLNLPYPLLQSAKYKWLFALLSGIFVFVFLIVFEPFGTARLTTYKYAFLAGIGFSVFLGVTATYFFLPQLYGQFFRPERWTIGKEILLQLCCILMVNVFICLHNYFVGRAEFSFQAFFGFLKITFSIGIFPIVGLIFFMERTLTKRNIKRAQLLSIKLPPAAEEKTTTVQIHEESVKASPTVMQLSEFVYAQSEGNYVTIYYLKEGILTDKLIRLSLKQLEIQLENLSQIKRCHRSYLINTQHIKSIDGNARALTIQLDKVVTSIPVSRSFSKADFY